MDITERKLAEEKLRRSEACLAETQRLSHTGSWAWNISSGDLFWSLEHFRIFGLDPQSTTPTYEGFYQSVHPDDRSRLKETFEQVVSNKAQFDGKYRIVRPDGTLRHIHSLANPVFNRAGELVEYLGTVMDITERMQVEVALRESEARFRNYFELGLIGMAITSPAKGILEVNGELCRILGYEREELLQKTWAEMTHPDDLAADVAQFNRVMAGEIDGYTLDKKWIRKDGQVLDSIMSAKCLRRAIRYHHGSGHPIAMQQGELEFIGMVVDVTERRQAEEGLRKLQAELAHVTRVTAMGELAASIAHEFNQPLGAIVNNCNVCRRLLRKPRLQKQIREVLTDIVQDINRTNAIITRIRFLTKPSVLERNPLQLKQVVADVLTVAQGELATRRITVQTDLAAGLPQIHGDRVQLQQVLFNLVINASDAMQTASAERRLLTITCRPHELDGRPAILLTVRDLGHGFKSPDTERLFDAFYTTKAHGMGMGLRISRSIVEAHGGRLWANPNDGAGATFSCSFPVAN